MSKKKPIERREGFEDVPEGVDVPEGAIRYVKIKTQGGGVFMGPRGAFMKRVLPPKAPETPKLPVAQPRAPTRNNHAFTDADRVKSHQARSVAIRPDLQEALDFPLIAIVEELTEKYHLTKNMANFLAVRLNFNTDTDAARAVGVAPRTPHSWRWSIPEKWNRHGPPVYFLRAYEELMQRAKEASQKKMNSLAWKTVNRIDEQLDAVRKVRRTVQTEDGAQEIIEEEPDYNARFQGIQGASRWLGEWGTEPRVVQNTQYVTVMDQFGKLMAKITEEKVVEGAFHDAEDGG